MALTGEAPAWMDQAYCRGKTEIFFPPGQTVQETPVQLRRARKICSDCPVFEECRDWVLDNYDVIPYGIWAGYPTQERAAIDQMLMPLYDWRETDWDVEKLSPRQQAAYEREARHAAERQARQEERARQAAERAERKAAEELAKEAKKAARASYLREVRDEYESWLKELRAEQEARRQRLKEVVRQREHERMLAALKRPECPNGHGKESTYKYRRTKQGQQIWDCYVCHTKVTEEVAHGS